MSVCPPKGGMGRGSREGLSRREAGRGGGVGGSQRGEGVWETEGVEQGRRAGKGSLGEAGEAREREASYQTLSRRSNYCQLGTPRLCRLS